jgi:hypothetical protein
VILPVAFHPFPKHGSTTQFFDYHGRVVQYAQSWGIFVPPLHTLRDDDPLGIWFTDLPIHVQHACMNQHHSVLGTCLKSSSTNLMLDPLFSSILTSYSDGYGMLLALATVCGHPLLQQYPSTAAEPRQNNDNSIATYVTLWVHYLNLRLLDGCVLSDRYFMQQFLRGLHPVFHQDFVTDCESKIAQFPIGHKLPASYTPNRILLRFQQRAQHLRRKDLIHKTARELTTRTPHIREIQTAPTEPDTESFDAFIHALERGSRSSACYLCGDTDHPVRNCPKLASIQSNPAAQSAIVRLLGGQTGPARPRRVVAAINALTSLDASDSEHSSPLVDDSPDATDPADDDPVDDTDPVTPAPESDFP